MNDASDEEKEDDAGDNSVVLNKEVTDGIRVYIFNLNHFMIYKRSRTIIYDILFYPHNVYLSL